MLLSPALVAVDLALRLVLGLELTEAVLLSLVLLIIVAE